MATLAVQAIAQQSEMVSSESHSGTVAEAFVALSSNGIEDCLAKRHSADSAVSSCQSNTESLCQEEREQSDSVVSSKSLDSMLEKSKSQDSDVQSAKEESKLSVDTNCSQESSTSKSSGKSGKSSAGRTEIDSDKFAEESCSSSSNSTLKGNDEENSCSSTSSTRTIKTGQTANKESDDESNTRSSFKSSSRRSSPEKQSQSQSTMKSSQSIANDISDNDSRDSSLSSHSKSTKASSQVVNDKSDNESTSRSSFKSSSRRSSPEKQSQSQSTIKSTQSTNHDLLEDNESRSSFTSSQSRSTKKDSQAVIDKDDDDSNSLSNFKLNSNKSSPEKENESTQQKKKYFSIVDSDSEDDIIVPRRSNVSKRDSDSDSAESDTNKKSKTKKTKKIKNVIDSDSDEDSVKKDKKFKKKKANSDKSDSDEERGDFSSTDKSKKLSNLIDSDSESDLENQSSVPENVSGEEENDEEKPKKGKKTSEKKRTGSARASKDAAMQQIYSETQRLIRESQLSLPYHRPKQRTLQEFLNRKKINASIPEIPKHLTNAERVKMFPEMISKVVKEKEKEAEIFYQSSDSEEDENAEEPMEVDESNKENEINIKNKNNDEISNATNISDTQKLTQDCIQESHNKREILQQRSLDFGVPRKLFMEDINDTEDTQNIEKDDYLNNEENDNSENLAQVNNKSKEVRTGLRESSVPKKLFTIDIEEMEMDIDSPNEVHPIKQKTENGKESVEVSNMSTVSTEKETSLEDSTEEFLLHLPETEATKVTESSEINKINSEKQVEESIMIGETSFKSHKELVKEDASKDENEKLKVLLEESDEDLDKDDEIIDRNVLRDDFGLPPEFDDPVKKPTMKEKLLASAIKFKPMIKASPGAVINFTDNEKFKEGLTKLLDRFARHSAVHVRPNTDEISEIKVLRTEGTGNDISVIEEVLPFKKALVEDDPKKESKPGEKLKKLREDLKRKIVTARNEEWKQKEDKEKEDEEEEAKCKGDDFYADLPDDEEILEDEESGESEPEEDDIPLVDKRRKKCDFGDEEAEESEDEGAEDNEINEDEEEDEEENEEEEEKEEESEDDMEKEEEEDEENIAEPKKLKRIIRPFDEDSNQSESSLSNDAVPKQTLERTKTDEDMFISQISNGSDADCMPPFQPRSRCGSDARSQNCKTPLLKSNNILSMISPVAQLTCLNTSLESEKKSASKTNRINLGTISSMKSPSDKSNQVQSNSQLEKMISLPKKLFEDPPESVNDDELLAICSGKFTNTQSSGVPVLNTQNGVTDSQLIAICSGAFTSQTINEKKCDSANAAEIIGDETSQDITLTLDDDEESRSSPNKKSSAAKKSDESMFSNDSKSPVKLPSFDMKAFKNPMEAWLSKAKKKPVESQKCQVTDSQLMNIISGEFPSQSLKSPLDKSRCTKEDQSKLFENNQRDVNDDELLALCSGKFPDTQICGLPSLDIQNGFQQKLFDKQSNNVNDDDLLAICSGGFPDTQTSKFHSISTQKKSISMEPASLSKEKDDEEASKAPWTGYTIVSSSEDEGNKAKKLQKKKKMLKKKKKKVQKLDLSDDEDDEPKEFSDEEEELDEIGDEDDEKYVDYDSEENEVITVSKKDIKKVATNYLENEAELSESDWDSADEDEQDLDKLEAEEGDEEEIDEDKMKDELDKIHMKRVMDEDQKEVRMLQELLFDDGDLHSEGAGRERKFKWKNIDNIEEDSLGPRTENDIDGIDDEVDTAAEIQIRKSRYEQQKFFEEQEKNLNKQLDDDFSELGKLGLKLVTMRSSSKSSTVEQTVKCNPLANNSATAGNRLVNVTNKSVTTTSFSFNNMRGSFLARGEETLTRIAKNLPEKNKLSINTVRNRKFVFEHLSPSVSKDIEEDEQENDDTPVKDKNDKSRKRKIFSSQTPRTTKKMKVDERTAGKKLF